VADKPTDKPQEPIEPRQPEVVESTPPTVDSDVGQRLSEEFDQSTDGSGNTSDASATAVADRPVSFAEGDGTGLNPLPEDRAREFAEEFTATDLAVRGSEALTEDVQRILNVLDRTRIAGQDNDGTMETSGEAPILKSFDGFSVKETPYGEMSIKVYHDTITTTFPDLKSRLPASGFGQYGELKIEDGETQRVPLRIANFQIASAQRDGYRATMKADGTLGIEFDEAQAGDGATRMTLYPANQGGLKWTRFSPAGDGRPERTMSAYTDGSMRTDYAQPHNGNLTVVRTPGGEIRGSAEPGSIATTGGDDAPVTEPFEFRLDVEPISRVSPEVLAALQVSPLQDSDHDLQLRLPPELRRDLESAGLLGLDSPLRPVLAPQDDGTPRLSLEEQIQAVMPYAASRYGMQPIYQMQGEQWLPVGITVMAMSTAENVMTASHSLQNLSQLASQGNLHAITALAATVAALTDQGATRQALDSAWFGTAPVFVPDLSNFNTEERELLKQQALVALEATHQFGENDNTLMLVNADGTLEEAPNMVPSAAIASLALAASFSLNSGVSSDATRLLDMLDGAAQTDAGMTGLWGLMHASGPLDSEIRTLFLDGLKNNPNSQQFMDQLSEGGGRGEFADILSLRDILSQGDFSDEYSSQAFSAMLRAARSGHADTVFTGYSEWMQSDGDAFRLLGTIAGEGGLNDEHTAAAVELLRDKLTDDTAGGGSTNPDAVAGFMQVSQHWTGDDVNFLAQNMDSNIAGSLSRSADAIDPARGRELADAISERLRSNGYPSVEEQTAAVTALGALGDFAPASAAKSIKDTATSAEPGTAGDAMNLAAVRALMRIGGSRGDGSDFALKLLGEPGWEASASLPLGDAAFRNELVSYVQGDTSRGDLSDSAKSVVSDSGMPPSVRSMFRQLGMPADMVDQALAGARANYSDGTIRDVLTRVSLYNTLPPALRAQLQEDEAFGSPPIDALQVVGQMRNGTLDQSSNSILLTDLGQSVRDMATDLNPQIRRLMSKSSIQDYDTDFSLNQLLWYRQDSPGTWDHITNTVGHVVTMRGDDTVDRFMAGQAILLDDFIENEQSSDVLQQRLQSANGEQFAMDVALDAFHYQELRNSGQDQEADRLALQMLTEHGQKNLPAEILRDLGFDDAASAAIAQGAPPVIPPGGDGQSVWQHLFDQGVGQSGEAPQIVVGTAGGFEQALADLSQPLDPNAGDSAARRAVAFQAISGEPSLATLQVATNDLLENLPTAQRLFQSGMQEGDLSQEYVDEVRQLADSLRASYETMTTANPPGTPTPFESAQKRLEEMRLALPGADPSVKQELSQQIEAMEKMLEFFDPQSQTGKNLKLLMDMSNSNEFDETSFYNWATNEGVKVVGAIALGVVASMVAPGVGALLVRLASTAVKVSPLMAMAIGTTTTAAMSAGGGIVGYDATSEAMRLDGDSGEVVGSQIGHLLRDGLVMGPDGNAIELAPGSVAWDYGKKFGWGTVAALGAIGFGSLLSRTFSRGGMSSAATADTQAVSRLSLNMQRLEQSGLPASRQALLRQWMSGFAKEFKGELIDEALEQSGQALIEHVVGKVNPLVEIMLSGLIGTRGGTEQSFDFAPGDAGDVSVNVRDGFEQQAVMNALSKQLLADGMQVDWNGDANSPMTVTTMAGETLVLNAHSRSADTEQDTTSDTSEQSETGIAGDTVSDASEGGTGSATQSATLASAMASTTQSWTPLLEKISSLSRLDTAIYQGVMSEQGFRILGDPTADSAMNFVNEQFDAAEPLRQELKTELNARAAQAEDAFNSILLAQGLPPVDIRVEGFEGTAGDTADGAKVVTLPPQVFSGALTAAQISDAISQAYSSDSPAPEVPNRLTEIRSILNKPGGTEMILAELSRSQGRSEFSRNLFPDGVVPPQLSVLMNEFDASIRSGQLDQNRWTTEMSAQARQIIRDALNQRNAAVNVPSPANTPGLRAFDAAQPANPLLDAALNDDLFAGTPDVDHRLELATKYSWAVPTREALAAIYDFAGADGIISEGAGNGYVEGMLSKMGMTIDAFDSIPPAQGGNGYVQAGSFGINVQTGSASTASQFASRALMLAYPPPQDPMAMEALNAYASAGGDRLVFIGEPNDHTGDQAFHDALAKDWILVETVKLPQVTTDTGMESSNMLYMYVRRGSERDPKMQGADTGGSGGQDQILDSQGKPISERFPEYSASEFERVQDRIFDELNQWQTLDGNNVGDRFAELTAKLGFTEAEAGQLLNGLATVREHGARRNPIDSEQELNWQHTQREFGAALDYAARNGLSKTETQDLLFAAMFSDGLKTNENFYTHHQDGALAFEHFARTQLKDLPQERISGIKQAILEHQIAPPQFMAFLYRTAIAKSFADAEQEMTAEDKAALESLMKKVANPFALGDAELIDVPGGPDGAKAAKLSAAEQGLLDRIGVRHWYIPHEGNAWNAASRGLIDSDGIDNYSGPGGLSKIIGLRGPGKAKWFQDRHVLYGTPDKPSEISSYDSWLQSQRFFLGDADRVMLGASTNATRAYVAAQQAVMEQYIDGARGRVNEWINSPEGRKALGLPADGEIGKIPGWSGTKQNPDLLNYDSPAEGELEGARQIWDKFSAELARSQRIDQVDTPPFVPIMNQ